MQTTDLHMHLLPYDYDQMAPAADRSFAHLRALITQQRADGVPTLLCDTGDFLQGNAMADIAATAPGTHPMIATFNALHYDAVVLGNHDFDYGIGPLERALSDLTCPALAANLEISGHKTRATPFTVVSVPTGAGDIRVGLLGLTVPPPPVADKAAGQTTIVTNPPLRVAPKFIDQIKSEGADVVVALCHFGIDPTDEGENVAAAVAALPGIDAVLAGHTHDVFPGPDISATKAIDPTNGMLHGKPAVMAGAFGKHLGVIELEMTRDANGWRVTTATSRVLQPRASPVPPPLPTPGLLALHDATLARSRTQIATTNVALTTNFSMIAPDISQQLLADARRQRIAKALARTEHADLPLLASAAPYRAGNKDAPTAFLDVAPGPVTLNDVIGIYPFQDPVIGLHQTGAQLMAWLERAAQRFAQLVCGVIDQPLLNANAAPYDLSSIYGLTYQIDPSQPIGSRISDLCHNGRALKASDRFIVATTPYRHRRDRAAGQADVITVTDEPSQEVLLDHLKTLGTIDLQAVPVWRFAPLADTAATFETRAAEAPQDHRYTITPTDPLADGLHRYRIAFS